MDHLTLGQLQGVDPRFDEHALKVFDYEHSVERKTAAGGTSRDAVESRSGTLGRMCRIRRRAVFGKRATGVYNRAPQSS